MSNETLRYLRNRTVPALLGISLAMIVSGCGDQGPAEEAGQEIDEAMDRAGERTEDAAREIKDTIDPPGPAERAGRAVDDAAQDLGGDE